MAGPEGARHQDARARRPGRSVRTRVVEHRAAADGEQPAPRHREDRLATEEPLEIRLAWPGAAPRRVWVTMRTPGHDFELAAGWLRHEGLVPGRARGAAGEAGPGEAPGALAGIAYCTDADLDPQQELNVVTAELASAPARDPGHRHDATTSGSSACGVCGKDSIAAALEAPSGGRWDGPLPSPDVIRRLPGRLREAQQVFERTGGVHAAALATAEGQLLVVREDVGRHNAVDKVTGARLLADEPEAGACLVVSGRAGFELVQKALAVGTGSLVAVGAPSSLAVDLAQLGGLALYGFTSADRTVQYA